VGNFKQQSDGVDKKVHFKLPKSLGACADLLYETQHKRYEIQKEIAKLSSLERALEERIIEELPKSEASGIAGKRARVKVVTKTIPVVESETGWDKIWDFIRKPRGKGVPKDFNGFSLLQRRLNTSTLKELHENGVVVPGVTTFTDVSISCTKV
jgi:hypothetical protein